MPTFPFSPLSDAALTIKKPITQSMMRRLRDDGYAKLPECGVTEELSTGKSLRPDGAGGVEWGDAGTWQDDTSAHSASVGNSFADVLVPMTGTSTVHFIAQSEDGPIFGVALFAAGVLVVCMVFGDTPYTFVSDQTYAPTAKKYVKVLANELEVKGSITGAGSRFASAFCVTV